MKNTTVPPTLESLIKQRIKEKGLSRFDLVSSLGYANISRGCRRLDTFIRTLEAPSEDFIINIASVLEIDPVTLYRAIKATLDQFSADAKRTFKPYIQIRLGIDITSGFAALAVYSKCSIPIPSHILEMPLGSEIETITALCKEHINIHIKQLSPNLYKNITGFNYHRHHSCYMKFNRGFTLEETVFIQPWPSGKTLWSYRVIDMMSGGLV